MSGIYVHIPFCRSRCIYCGFYSTTRLGLRARYIDVLCREMELRKDYLHGTFATVYIGGGTPSQLGVPLLRRLLDHIYKVYTVESDAEVTVECNPDDVTPALASELASMPVNRVSMGVQTFSDERLRFLHRRHTAAQAAAAVENLRHAGITNISIDLMFGFPGQTMTQWQADIRRALELAPEHISAYSLMYEDGTPLKRMLDNRDIEPVDDGLSLAMYDALADTLAAAGYEHYEISNFARPGYRSRHNSSYWQQEPYIGLGAAAHSFDMRSRQWNTASLTAYTAAIEQGHIPMEREVLDARTTYNDIITTALRTADGLNTDSLAANLGRQYATYLLDGAEPYIARGLMQRLGAYLRLTRRGIYISDTIMSDLMMV